MIDLTTIAEVPVVDLARQFGTPTYVYCAKTIQSRIQNLKQFDVIRYAQKANPHSAILQIVKQHGCCVDAVSSGEIYRALQQGFDPHSDPPGIVYTADVFDRTSMELIARHQIPVNCGSPDMIPQAAEIMPGAEIMLRVNPGFGHGHSNKTNTGGPASKHGIWHSEIESCVQAATALGLKVTGLHIHIGSGTDLHHLSKVAHAMRDMASRIGPRLTTISAGGGLPVPYAPGDQSIDLNLYFQVWNEQRQTIEQDFQHPVRLEIEPGRYIVAESGWLIAEVRAVKQTSKFYFYLVDTGFNHLVRPAMYGSYHPMTIVSRNDAQPAIPMQQAVVAGPLCESGDVFTQLEGGVVVDRQLPPARVGDLLVISHAGAYGMAMASNYNSQPLPAEVMIENGTPRIISRRQSLEEMLCREIVTHPQK